MSSLDSFAPGGISRLSIVAGFEQIAESASEDEMIANLSKNNRKLVANLSMARDLAGKNGDNKTEGLMTTRIQIHEKHIWMLDSFLAS
ncbi:MAG TPA: hypothetical protein DCS60_06365 [Opitutae bacterium]|nr:hypothetical protein [Opitutae bacterium]